MKCVMKGGALYVQENMVIQIKGVFAGPEKQILAPDGRLLLQATIHNLDAPQERRGDVRFRQYRLLDAAGAEVACAKPDYAADEDPSVFGWPICRMPRVDHARVSIGKHEYCLTMKNRQHYRLEQPSGAAVVRLLHRGLIGGWDIDADDAFRPELLCGIFLFCRYMEQENEFLVV